MTYYLIIFYYLLAAAVDLMDKFLISARKIRPLSYTFYTVVMGALLLVLWPWNYEHITFNAALLDVFSGLVFALCMYVFFRALSEGEASRVIPFVFGIVPVTDLLLGAISGRNSLDNRELAAIFLLIPGALLIAHKKGSFSGRHVLLKLTSAFLWSLYYFIWQLAAEKGNVLNHLMWNRLGAALVLVLILVLPAARKNIFGFKEVKAKKQTSILFLAKQLVGGANFIFLSFLLVVSKISIVNGLQGFRYIFLFLAAVMLASSNKNPLKEEISHQIIWQKLAAIGLIFAGTIILFV